MLRTLISADRDGHYPKGVTYPMIDLALDGLIGVTDLALLDPLHFPDRVLPSNRFGGLEIEAREAKGCFEKCPSTLPR
jgi:hypothetical protein